MKTIRIGLNENLTYNREIKLKAEDSVELEEIEKVITQFEKFPIREVDTLSNMLQRIPGIKNIEIDLSTDSPSYSEIEIDELRKENNHAN